MIWKAMAKATTNATIDMEIPIITNDKYSTWDKEVDIDVDNEDENKLGHQ